MRTAVCPVWFGSISVDDIFTGARKGERYFTLSVLLGDVILVQAGRLRAGVVPDSGLTGQTVGVGWAAPAGA